MKYDSAAEIHPCLVQNPTTVMILINFFSENENYDAKCIIKIR